MSCGILICYLNTIIMYTALSSLERRCFYRCTCIDTKGTGNFKHCHLQFIKITDFIKATSGLNFSNRTEISPRSDDWRHNRSLPLQKCMNIKFFPRFYIVTCKVYLCLYLQCRILSVLLQWVLKFTWQRYEVSQPQQKLRESVYLLKRSNSLSSGLSTMIRFIFEACL